MHKEVKFLCDLNNSSNRCSGPLKEGSSTILLCVPLHISLSDFFKDRNNRREFNSGLYFEGQVGFPPASRPAVFSPFPFY